MYLCICEPLKLGSLIAMKLALAAALPLVSKLISLTSIGTHQVTTLAFIMRSQRQRYLKLNHPIWTYIFNMVKNFKCLIWTNTISNSLGIQQCLIIIMRRKKQGVKSQIESRPIKKHVGESLPQINWIKLIHQRNPRPDIVACKESNELFHKPSLFQH